MLLKKNKMKKFKINKHSYYASDEFNARRLRFLHHAVKYVYLNSVYSQKYKSKFPKIILIESSTYKTMTINKRIIHVNFRRFDDRELIYQLIHEIAHILCKTCFGHNDEWNVILNNLAFTYFQLRPFIFENF